MVADLHIKKSSQIWLAKCGNTVLNCRQRARQATKRGRNCYNDLIEIGGELDMDIRLDATVLDIALQATGARGDEALGQIYLGRTGSTVRSYRRGETVPPISVLVRLRHLTGWPIDRMIIPGKAVEIAA